MRILLIHNFYQQPGGEDVVFKSEGELLSSYGHTVERMVFDNTAIQSKWDQLKAAIYSIYNPKSYRLLVEKIRSFSPDIIHVHNFWPLASPSIFYAAKKYDIPIVLTLHNFRLLCPGATLFYNGEIYEKSLKTHFPTDAIRKGIYRNSKLQTALLAITIAYHHYAGTWKNKIDGYIMLSHFQKEKFIASKLHIPKEKFMVKHNFVQDTGRGKLEKEDFFLFVGRLTPEKGIETLLTAAQRYQFDLMIIGDGPLRYKVEAACQANKHIVYRGHLPWEKVQVYMKRCKAFLSPSVWYEGFPLTMLEAFASGAPVIASRLGSMKEIVQHEFNGLLFEPGNAMELGYAVNRILYDEDLAIALTMKARISYVQKYSPKINYKMLIKIYEEVINTHTPKVPKWETLWDDSKMIANKS